MAKSNLVHTKKKMLLIVLLFAAVLAGLILLLNHSQAKIDLSTEKGRVSFLSECGWEIDPETEEHKLVMIPDALEGVMEDYNQLQLKQGYDLNDHLGEKCEQFSYEITNYPDSDQTVIVTLYVQGRKLIAGDIHSTALNGFMHGLKD